MTISITLTSQNCMSLSCTNLEHLVYGTMLNFSITGLTSGTTTTFSLKDQNNEFYAIDPCTGNGVTNTFTAGSSPQILNLPVQITNGSTYTFDISNATDGSASIQFTAISCNPPPYPLSTVVWNFAGLH